jgi:hypothetical protein
MDTGEDRKFFLEGRTRLRQAHRRSTESGLQKLRTHPARALHTPMGAENPDIAQVLSAGTPLHTPSSV